MKEQPHPFKAVKSAAVPIVAFETADPKATIVSCMKARNGKPEIWLVWDLITGLLPVTPGDEIAQTAMSTITNDESTINLVDCLSLIARNYTRSDTDPAMTVFIHMANRLLEDPANIQAVWNLRDKFKERTATLVLLGPSFRLPEELKNDCVVISEALPDAEALEAQAKRTCEEADVNPKQDWIKVVDTLRGLSMYGAEQTVALSFQKVGKKVELDMVGLWERKRKMVEQTPGLKVWRGGEKFADIGGCDAIKAYLSDYMKGPARMRAVVWIDEIEKCLAGSGGGDLSGVSSDYLGQLLTYMQDSGARGMIFVGPPGAAKSAIAKCCGNEANVPTINLDLGGMKGSLVGQSETQLRNALKVITAISGGDALWLATCNSLAVLPPELKRRFSLGIWFFDLPTLEERRAIWPIYQAKYPGVESDIGPDDLPGYTGAEIRALFDTAWSTGRSLKRAAKIIVPVCKSGADKIAELRKIAAGKFTSAGREGIYQVPESVDAPTGGRRMEQ
jgi:ATPase family protein associated with various cellular activities (AAA)